MKAIACALALAALGCKKPAKEKPPTEPLFTPPSPTATPAKPTAGHFRFSNAAAPWGLAARHHAGRTAAKHMPEIMGAGVVIDDFDRNGALDLIVLDSGSMAGEVPAGNGSRLFLGDGRGGFRDATKDWGLNIAPYVMGAIAGDFDNDGWTDLFITRWGKPDVGLRNKDGRGFVDATATWGIGGDGGWSTSAGVFDLENDGDLDLFVVRYVEFDPANAIRCYVHQTHVYCTPLLYKALPDRLFRNDRGTFTDLSTSLERGADAGKGLALGAADIDGDGSVDVYVANDSTRNHLWLARRGSLEEGGSTAGLAYSELGREQASMGVDVSDANGDGRWDLAVPGFQAETTSLYMQGAGFFFQEQSDRAGIGATARARLKFGIDFFDADNDGDEDLLVANGHLFDNIETFRGSVSFGQLNTLYENVGDGRFADVTESSGEALADKQVSRGLATGDLDQDGDLDFVVANNDGNLQVGRNDGAKTSFVSLWLEGKAANRSAVGALVVAKVGARTIRRQVTGAESYLSQSSRRIHLGLGTATQADSVTITWPGDPKPQELGAVTAGQFLRVVQGQAPQPYKPGEKVIAP